MLPPPKPRCDETTQKLGPAIGVRLPIDVDEQIRQMPNPTKWLRQIITEAVENAKKLD
jgi:hypothetical protein